METLVDKMTGAELKKLYLRSRGKYETVKAFAAHLGFGKTHVSNAFRADTIPDDIDGAIDQDPILKEEKNKILRGVESMEIVKHTEKDTQNMGELIQVLATTITQSISQSITQVVNVMTDQMDRREKDYELIRKTNTAVMESNSTIMSQFVNITNHLLDQQPQHQGKPKFGPSLKK